MQLVIEKMVISIEKICIPIKIKYIKSNMGKIKVCTTIVLALDGKNFFR